MSHFLLLVDKGGFYFETHHRISLFLRRLACCYCDPVQVDHSNNIKLHSLLGFILSWVFFFICLSAMERKVAREFRHKVR